MKKKIKPPGNNKKKKNYSLRDGSGVALKVSVESRSGLRHFRGNAAARRIKTCVALGGCTPSDPPLRLPPLAPSIRVRAVGFS